MRLLAPCMRALGGKHLLIALLVISSVAWFSSLRVVAAEPCDRGIALAKAGDWRRAHIEWRFLASNASYKEWLRATLDCLQEGRFADSDRDAAIVLGKMSKEPGGLDAAIQLAMLFATGVGVERDYGRAQALLEDAARDGSEVAAFFLKQLDQIKREDSVLGR